MYVKDVRICWYAACTTVNQEFRIKKLLDGLGVECFLPTHTVVRQWSDRKRVVEVPLIRSIVFVRTDPDRALSLLKEHGMKARYMYDYAQRSILTIPDRQMEDFMFLIRHSQAEELQVLKADFAPGDKVRVVEGTLTGLEGELIRVEGKTQVLIRVSQVAALSVKVGRSQVVRIK